MIKNKDVLSLFLCYVLWGFQPLYWSFTSQVNPYVILCCRIIMAALFSVLILAFTHRLTQLRDIFLSKSILKFLIPATVFLFLDWAVFIVVVNSGHVLDASLGYYINPLVLFIFGVVIYREKCSKIQLLALGIAVAGVAVSTVGFGTFPFISVIIAVNWAVYAALKKNVRLDGVLSIAAETLILTPFAIAFLLIFKRSDFALMGAKELLFMAGSGIVTALPMFLYSNSVAKFPLIIMCFAQYLSPTFNLICGMMMGESFSKSQLISFAFFVAAIIVFTVSEVMGLRKDGGLAGKNRQ